MIRLEQCTKIYHPGKPNELVVLDDISLRINEGDMIAIMGKSGSGKTTLLNLIGLLDEPTRGEIYFREKKLSTHSEKMRSRFRGDHIGIVLQNFALLLEEKVTTNILLSKYFCRKKDSAMLSIAEVIKVCGLKGMEKRKVKELSGGQMQRVAIARALLTNPDLILADEPTGSLDTQSSREIMALFQYLNRQGKTILVVTHDRDVASFCRKMIIIENG